MKTIVRSRQFIKSYKTRIAPNKALVKRFGERLKLFLDGERGLPLNDHALAGKLQGMRAFAITGDIRLIYHETETYYRFIDIGAHNQVY